MKEVQTELKKEITCVTDSSTNVLGTTIRAEVQEIDQKFQNKQVELKKEIIEQIEEISKGLEKRRGEIRKTVEESQEKVGKEARRHVSPL
jgi:hypothetical protein